MRDTQPNADLAEKSFPSGLNPSLTKLDSAPMDSLPVDPMPIDKVPVQTVMALDFGVVKMGVALGNTLTQTARPLTQFPMNNGKPHWDNLLKLIQEWQASHIIVGLPLNMDGTTSELSLRCHKFARRLNQQLQEHKIACAVTLVDERLTSREARLLAWEYGLISEVREPIDSIAAAILLGSWLRGMTGETLS